MKYVYPAVFTEEDSGYSIHFPDLESCYTSAETLEEGMEMANDVLCLVLYHLEEDGKEIPAASDIKSLQPGPGSFTTLISCKMSAERRQSGSLCLVPSFAFCLTSQRCSSADTDPAVHLYTQSKPPGLTEYRFPCTFVGRSPSVLRLWGSAVHRHFHTA